MTSELDALRARIESALDAHLPASSNLSPTLTDAMRYATLSGGKRLRPLFLCATCTAVGGDARTALAPACAIEFLHAYSLVHDDLPAMDDDELRHGVPSTHIRFDEATAILAGDALQALAFRTLADAPDVTATARLRALTLLADAAGWNGMVGGQSLDLEAERRRLELPELAALHGAKTGALIRAAIQIGAIVGDPDLSDEVFDGLGEFAGQVGLAFQVVDDVLDITATTDALGKPAGSDIKAGKSTYPGLLGLDEARAYAESLLQSALALHAKLPLQHSLLADLAVRSVRRVF
jgi:geranylgeranyl diphosphate synthase type II